MADLEERLREQADWYARMLDFDEDDSGIGPLQTMLREAADHISAQTQTISDQVAEIDRLKNNHLETLHAGVQQTISALTRALNGFIWCDNNRHNYGTPDWLDYFDAAMNDARAALSSARSVSTEEEQ